MMFRILAAALCAAAPFTNYAQSPANQAFAITSETYGGFEWTEVKKIDLRDGSVVRDIYQNRSTDYKMFDGRSGRSLSPSEANESTDTRLQPFSGLSAACAYDAKMNRLFYAPLFINQLRYIDLKAAVPSIYVFQNEKFTTADQLDAESEASQITRMVIASDGNGYAMDNSARHLVRFTTDEKPVITDLGSLYNASENGDISVHDANTSWGGDLLADASGNLYLISATNYVFRINVQTRAATFLSKIKNLPISFTSNGAVVDEEGKIVISSANYLTAYYRVDPQTWEATAISGNDQIHNTSDLANQNLLFQTPLVPPVTDLPEEETVTLFPNPVRQNTFKIRFEKKESGRYDVELLDVSGKRVGNNAVSFFKGHHISEVRLNQSVARGVYIVKVSDPIDRTVLMKKVIIE